MMVSLLGSAQQSIQILFLVRYLVLQPLWVSLKTAAAHPIVEAVLSLLTVWGSRQIPFE